MALGVWLIGGVANKSGSGWSIPPPCPSPVEFRQHALHLSVRCLASGSWPDALG
jgi:hypothetical protein